ncbi:hypothetical protein [Catenulispora subtropica]|uniref:Uncharacterized protein n=1 Tax=Catenulispora subtropica TaxID=450798 RepID=A0ABP5CIU6_9ACTN
MTNPNVRCQAYELGELFWEHDRLALQSLNEAQRKAQCTARERLHRHARRVQDLLEAGELPAGDPRQQAAAAGMVDLTLQLWEHARDEDNNRAGDTVRHVRLPIPAPATIWRESPASPTEPTLPEQHDAAMVCRRCGMALERTQLAGALGRPSSQGWRHVDGRKSHLPEPVFARSSSFPTHR